MTTIDPDTVNLLKSEKKNKSQTQAKEVLAHLMGDNVYQIV